MGKKEKYSIIGIVLTSGCQIAKIFYPDFPAEEISQYIITICGIFIGTHTISDVTNMISTKNIKTTR